jgi:hypothetical protein
MQAGVGKVGIRYSRKPGEAGGNSASVLLGDEPTGFAIDFLQNSYFIRMSDGSETLLWGVPQGLAIDFTDNSYVVKV